MECEDEADCEEVEDSGLQQKDKEIEIFGATEVEINKLGMKLWN
jgi:hypothetical protein